MQAGAAGAGTRVWCFKCLGAKCQELRGILCRAACLQCLQLTSSQSQRALGRIDCRWLLCVGTHHRAALPFCLSTLLPCS